MLLKYFQFREQPFGATPDPRFLYYSSSHREALASLYCGFYGNRGFTALIASPGMGKTMLLFHFLDHICDSARSVFLFNTQFEPRELIRYILRELGITPGSDQAEMHHQLNEVLLTETRAGRRFVVVIDEAQNLSDEALETVRLLTNFETPRTKLMQIVLAGQPQLSAKLMRSSLVQLRQRVSTICRLEPFSAADTAEYIEHRLKLAGYAGGPLFTPRALQLVTEAANGIPRMINSLCFNALSVCCALKARQVSHPMVAEVIDDLQLDKASEGIPHLLSEKHDSDERPLSGSEQIKSKTGNRVKLRVPVAAATLFAIGLMLPLGASSNSKRHVRSPEYTAQVTTPVSPSLPQMDISDATQKTFDVTVEPNQTLRKIALRYMGHFDEQTLREIRTLNPGVTDPDTIQAGWKIKFPKQPLVDRGDVTLVSNSGEHVQ